MIRVYLDWNVMVQLKAGSLPDLQQALSDKTIFLSPYSTSHIGDILASYKKDDQAQNQRIKKDLDFITSLTDNYCLSNNGKQVILDTTDPHSLFEQRIENIDLLDDFGLGKIEELFSVEGMPEGIGDSVMALLKSMPLDDDFKAAFINPETKDSLQKLFPDLGDNPTMEDFFRSFGKMFKNLNENEGYKGLREITQEGLGIKRDKIFNDNDPFSSIDTAHSKLGYNWEDYIDHSKYAPEWFNRITNEYLKLDVHGYQEDKVEVKPKKRKQTFANTTEDGSHAAFASMCHYYLTSDSRTFRKTQKVYEHLGVNTSVLKPHEFLNAYNESLRLKIESVEHFSKVILNIMNTKRYEEDEVEERTHRTYYLNFFIFDFFNRLSVIMGDDENKPTFMLGRVSPTNSSGIYVFEIRKLIQRLNYFFGVEDSEFGNVSEDVLKAQTWSGLVYQFEGFHFRLLSYNGYVQLYLNLGD